MKNKLYGDGVHDDTAAIQEMLDSKRCEVVLEAPENFYLISSTLKIYSGQTLRTAPTTRIRLADGSSVAMLENADFNLEHENITVDGGIWDMNNTAQEPNPWHFKGSDGLDSFDKLGTTRADCVKTMSTFTALPDVYTGFCMRFCRIKGFTLKNATFRNPVTYGVQMTYIENFTVRDITFDYTTGSPKLWNMDGVHLEGFCKNGYIANLKGACHDDLLALTADDGGCFGPIENITVDGLFAEGCHSAVRLLSHGVPIKNVTIRNVYGSYYTYCIGLTKYHGGPEERGKMSNINISNVFAHSTTGTKDVPGGKSPLITVQAGLDIDGLRIDNVLREEDTIDTPLFKIYEDTVVKNLILNDVKQRNLLGRPIPFIVIEGSAPDASITLCKEI